MGLSESGDKPEEDEDEVNCVDDNEYDAMDVNILPKMTCGALSGTRNMCIHLVYIFIWASDSYTSPEWILAASTAVWEANEDNSAVGTSNERSCDGTESCRRWTSPYGA